MRVLILFLLFIVTPAYATPCSVATFYDGFSGQFFGSTLTGFMFGLDEQYLYVTFPNGVVSGFIQVPQQVAQSFNYSKTPDAFYAQNILHRYKRPLMTETCVNFLTDKGAYLVL